MANVRPSVMARNAMLNGIRDLIDAGSAGGKINIYDGAQPTTGDDPLYLNRLLATLTFARISAPDATNGLLIFDDIGDDKSAAASGTATWARITDSNGIVVMDVDVGTLATSIIITTTAIEEGRRVQATFASIKVA